MVNEALLSLFLDSLRIIIFAVKVAFALIDYGSVYSSSFSSHKSKEPKLYTP
jgi:Na+/H+ antiporter NhaB